jgi:hypothetical protein
METNDNASVMHGMTTSATSVDGVAIPTMPTSAMTASIPAPTPMTTKASASEAISSVITGGGKRKHSKTGTVSTAHPNDTDDNSNSDNSKDSKPKRATRINWAKSPHRERLSQILHDWFSHTGQAIDAATNEPITDYRTYCDKVGISRTTFFKYIHKDPTKRMLVKDENECACRGKKRLIDVEGIKFIVSQLKAKADV